MGRALSDFTKYYLSSLKIILNLCLRFNKAYFKLFLFLCAKELFQAKVSLILIKYGSSAYRFYWNLISSSEILSSPICSALHRGYYSLLLPLLYAWNLLCMHEGGRKGHLLSWTHSVNQFLTLNSFSTPWGKFGAFCFAYGNYLLTPVNFFIL